MTTKKMTPARAEAERLIRAGAMLANVAHNLAQPGWPLDDITRESLKSGQLEWDAALNAYRAGKRVRHAR